MSEIEGIKTPTWRDRIQLGASEVMYLIGLGLLVAGIWVWFGVGQALAAGGVVLLTSSTLNGIVRDSQLRGK